MATKINKLTKGDKVCTGFNGTDGGIAVISLEVIDDKPVKIFGLDTIECSNTNTGTTKRYSIKKLIANHNDLLENGLLP